MQISAMETRPKRHLMNEALAISLRNNTDQLLQVISKFDYPAFNHKLGADRWSAGEIAEHLLLFDIRLNTILTGNTLPAGRDPQEKITTFTTRLEDLTQKLEAPLFLIPSSTTKDPTAMAAKIIAARNKLLQLVQSLDLSLVLPDTPHRTYGMMTGIEWVNFSIHHTNRHLIQLNILFNPGPIENVK